MIGIQNHPEFYKSRDTDRVKATARIVFFLKFIQIVLKISILPDLSILLV